MRFALIKLSTNVVPASEWQAVSSPDERLLGAWHRLGRRLAESHLPQGAPTSPALANLSAFGLDRRLSALAASMGATYSRYADDLAFSGGRELNSRAPALRRAVAAIVADEGFRLNPRKSALATRACIACLGCPLTDTSTLGLSRRLRNQAGCVSSPPRDATITSVSPS